MQSGHDAQFSQWIADNQVRRAAEWLTRTYAGEVLGLCRAMVRPGHVAEDLAQDVFSRALSSIEGFRGEASPRTWLLKIARNRCIDHLRSQNRRYAQHWDDTTDPDHQAAELPLPSDLLSRRGLIENALDHLDETDRALVVLRFGHGLDYSELAAAFGVRPGTARMRVSRALDRMRSALESHELVPAGAPAQAAWDGAPSADAPAQAARDGAPSADATRRTRAGVLPVSRSRAPLGPRSKPAPPGSTKSLRPAPGAPPPAGPPAAPELDSLGGALPAKPPPRQRHALADFFQETLPPPPPSFMQRLAQLVSSTVSE